MIITSQLHALATKLAESRGDADDGRAGELLNAVMNDLAAAPRLPFGFRYVKRKTWISLEIIVKQAQTGDGEPAAGLPRSAGAFWGIAEVLAIAAVVILIPETYMRRAPFYLLAVLAIMIAIALWTRFGSVAGSKRTRGRRSGDGTGR
jgi:hypothetical protein